jgi:hypothetical protein
MTIREQLAREIEQTPDALVEGILDFCLFIKQRKAKEKPNESATQPNGILDLLEQVKEIQSQIPTEEWDKLSHDGAVNHDHYLYGASKVEG